MSARATCRSIGGETAPIHDWAGEGRKPMFEVAELLNAIEGIAEAILLV
jgi:hypothetical protein